VGRQDRVAILCLRKMLPMKMLPMKMVADEGMTEYD